ncbi:BEACH domain [Pseudocohnilembus persalinus]|uniref:BEACH domain n=1 Tax=Pseudocohnilembus persalinus TaxID=266149 RepID=A0A0V0R6L9_PSEPJ|nr:BEACH domain [Pseudocohnilembus persalinus]|eukprot:KRX09994.1 BEACH domain [Pseudocohnilembus persalinus]
MIRKVPEFVIKLQNGVFGPTDRIFRGIDTTWSAAMNLDADFKELIPEFYNLDGDFLINSEQLELGITQDGEIIDDVVIPSWANNYHDLLSKMKMALECDYTSSHLNEWIDLIFGFKQTGEEAVLSDNLFYPYTYEHNVKWDQIENDYQKQAMKIQVQEFGQCPVQLFNQPHILRKR